MMKGYCYVKRGVDILLSGIAIVVLSPLLLLFCIAIILDSPGPILFRQKRVGIHKSYFQIYKFRTMRIDTPKDVPTHMLENPDQYITKVGKFLRKTSLDELPQIFNIFKGDMSIVGPRPALWNQDDLVAERDKYGANDVTPGLTGWAQIHGRDELEIVDKARLDGEYVEKMGPWIDIRCFIGTIGSVLKHDGVVEGGTGELHKSEEETAANKRERIEPEKIKTEETEEKRILITGADSYVGTSVEAWLQQWPRQYHIDTLDMRQENWREYDFSGYDIVYHVAGIAHADVGEVTEEQKKAYYQVNTNLAVETAGKAKQAGVSRFIFMSSMIVYSGCKEKVITKDTKPQPLNFYGDSKWQAEQKIRELEDASFQVVILRPPMIYGKGSKGNYPLLAKLATKLPVFPIVKNQRSMLYIDNLAQFVKLMIDNEESGVFFPQNAEYSNTSDMVQMIAQIKNHRIMMLPLTNGLMKLLGKMPGKIGALAQKAFGDSVYEMSMSEYKEDYRVYGLRESIEETEREVADKEGR